MKLILIADITHFFVNLMLKLIRDSLSAEIHEIDIFESSILFS